MGFSAKNKLLTSRRSQLSRVLKQKLLLHFPGIRCGENKINLLRLSGEISLKKSPETKISNSVCYIQRKLLCCHVFVFKVFGICLNIGGAPNALNFVEWWTDKLQTEYTHSQGKYYCSRDLLFEWIGFDQTSKSVII